MTASVDWPVWSTTARIVVTRAGALVEAQELVRAYLDRVDLAASRFRDDAEVALVARAGGVATPVSPLLAELVGVALDAARRTQGAVDPTVGGWLCGLGYDRDLAELPAVDGASDGDGPARLVVHAAADWRAVTLDRDPAGQDWLTVPAGVLLDLGATAKAHAADRCAELVAERLDTGVLVSLGGDIATAGPARDWRVLVQDRPGDPAQTVTVPTGTAVASSSTVSRRWRNAGVAVHHIVDPRTGRPASTRWRTATVAAGSCVDANTVSTAALVRGDGAVGWLRRTGLPARLVGADRQVVRCGAWPESAWPEAGG